MFYGRYEHAIDQKGRISIPSKFRATLEERYDQRLILTNQTDECLEAYPVEEWKTFVENAPAVYKTEQEREDFQRFVVGGAMECTVDRQGRILIPPVLREYAQLGREVVFVGATNRFEIWNKTKFEAIWKSAQERLRLAKMKG